MTTNGLNNSDLRSTIDDVARNYKLTIVEWKALISLSCYLRKRGKLTYPQLRLLTVLVNSAEKI